jgi:hypothetical protein
MKVLGYLIAACIALAGLRLVVAALVLCIFLAVIVAMITKPRETVGLTLIMAAAGAFNQRPIAFVVVAGLVIAACLILKTIDEIPK